MSGDYSGVATSHVRKWSSLLTAMSITLVLGIPGCSGSGDQEVVVSAASSLTDAFQEIEVAWETANLGYDLVLNLGGSSTLREQILSGAPADVFASAATKDLDLVSAAGLLRGQSITFAKNVLVIALPSSNPAGVTGISDLSDPDLLVGLCAVGVPCGDLARRVLSLSGVEPNVVTDEPNVRSLLTKIEAGELDAGLVYATDITSADVIAVSIPDEFNREAEYAIAVLGGASEGASLFVDFVLSFEGQKILSKFGFEGP